MNFEKHIQELIEKKWTFVDNFLTFDFCEELIKECNQLHLKKAQIGQGTNKSFHPDIRNDSIFWLDDFNLSELQKKYILKANTIKDVVNRELYLGLKEFECHYARYDHGNFYKKHTDQFQGNNARTLTLITYLNTPESGGELVIYKGNSDEIDAIVTPKTGLMVCFISDQLYHEVKPTKDLRYSLTGWFKNKIS